MDLIFLILLLKRLLQLYHRIFSNPSLNLLNYIPIILILKNYFYTLIKISNSNNSNNNPSLINNFYSTPFVEHSTISNDLKAKRFSPYDVSIKTTHKRTGQFQQLVNECYAPQIFK